MPEPKAQDALDRIAPLVYDELRALARSFMRRERPGHTLQPSALVHEAWLRLSAQHGVSWQNRAHVLAVAAQMMRRILASHAKARAAAKRGGGGEKITLDPSQVAADVPPIDAFELDQALKKLAEVDPEKVRIVELRFYAGLTNEEVAEVTGKSRATVARAWSFARAWLLRELGK